MSYRSKVAIVYLLGFFVDLINMFIANVAYPAIGQAMRASVSQLAWVSNGYILGLTLVIRSAPGWRSASAGGGCFCSRWRCSCWPPSARATPRASGR